MDEIKSKSQKKREADELQKIGIQLVTLREEQLDSLSLTPSLRQAIIDAKSIKSHGASRRQAQLIGKLMRSDDYERIVMEYEQLLSLASAQTAAFHDVETWRTRLMTEGKAALTAFVSQFEPDDIQSLRQLIKKAVDEQNKGVSMGAYKALFRYLRSVVL